MKLWRKLPLLALAFAALAGMAQNSTDNGETEDVETGNNAILFLRFDRLGSINVSLDLLTLDSTRFDSTKADSADAPPSFDAVWTALAKTLHCPIAALNSPNMLSSPLQLPKGWSVPHRERYRKQIAEAGQRRVEGICNSVLANRDGVLQADLDYSALAAELQRAGIDQLYLYADIPQTVFREYTRDNLAPTPAPGPSYLTYRIPIDIDTAQGQRIFHVAYGLRRSDVRRAFIILGGFLLLPVLLTLWLRRSALASAQLDAPAAWFGFFRTMNALLTGTMLLWFTSSLGARATLAEYIAGLGYSPWAAASWNALISIGPVVLIYFFCLALSYPLHKQVRGTELTRHEFLVVQAVAAAAKTYPFLLAFACLEMVNEQLELSIALLLLTLGFFQILQLLKMRVLHSFPRSLTSGELYDRILALAARLRVHVSKIVVLSAGKTQIANAFASKGKVVTFTDRLLGNLTRREVDAIAAHELAHLKHKHTAKRGAVFIGALFLPACFTWLHTVLSGMMAFGFLAPYSGGSLADDSWAAMILSACWSGLTALNQSSLRDFVLVMLGLTAFYFMARHQEYVADETAVRLTGDPEAQISSLLHISRLNFVPIQWGRIAETWLTHPSTVQRVERIAAAGGMPPERLQQILAEYAAHPVVPNPSASATIASEDRYPIPSAADDEQLHIVSNRRYLARLKVWAVRFVAVIPPVLFAWLIERLHLAGAGSLVAYFVGVVLTTVIVLMAGVGIARAGYGREKLRLLRRLQRDHIPAGAAGDVFIGLAPTPFPRVFSGAMQFYDWDRGFLTLTGGRLQFVGEKTRFALTPSEIDKIVVGPGGPSWWNLERIYFRWKDAANDRSGIMNLFPLEPGPIWPGPIWHGSIWHARASVRALHDRLQAWRREAGEKEAEQKSATQKIRQEEGRTAEKPGGKEVRGDEAGRVELSALSSPDIGGIQCISPKVIAKFSTNLKALAILLPIVIGLSILCHVGIWYPCASIIILRVIQSIPFWRYRDRPPLSLHAADAIKARGATAR